jgi:hypothetical protein
MSSSQVEPKPALPEKPGDQGGGDAVERVDPTVEWLLPTGWYFEGLMLESDFAGRGPDEAEQRPEVTETLSLEFIRDAYRHAEMAVSDDDPAEVMEAAGQGLPTSGSVEK